MHAWVAEMSAYIKQLDGNHLVAIGDEGWRCDLQGDHSAPFQWMNNGTKACPDCGTCGQGNKGGKFGSCSCARVPSQ